MDDIDELNELERTIAEIIARREEASEDSAAHRMAVRQLEGLRLTREEAGGIIEALDPWF